MTGLISDNPVKRSFCDSKKGGLVESIEMVVQEYKQTRGLLPIKINILGPPGVGKSSIAKAIAAHYRIHHVTTKVKFNLRVESSARIGD